MFLSYFNYHIYGTNVISIYAADLHCVFTSHLDSPLFLRVANIISGEILITARLCMAHTSKILKPWVLFTYLPGNNEHVGSQLVDG